MGPLDGMRVVEFVGMGPGPFAGMLLADLGADVVRVERPQDERFRTAASTVMARGQRSVALNLKATEGVKAALQLVAAAEVIIDPYRPGVLERLGLGPSECHAVNPQLVFGRITGWGQHGPYADRAGHDINYIALSGALSVGGRREGPPVPAANLVGDFGGGSMLLALGILSAVVHARATGQGQVVDAAMVDGSALLTAMIHEMRAAGDWGPRGTNLIDTGAPFYDVYQAADGGWVSVGALEPHFYLNLIDVLGLGGDETMQRAHTDRELWPVLRQTLARRFATRTRVEWDAAFEGRDACFAPVWEVSEVAQVPHLVERGTFIHANGVTQPAPAPRFSVTQPRVPGAAPEPGADTQAVMGEWGVDLVSATDPSGMILHD